MAKNTLDDMAEAFQLLELNEMTGAIARFTSIRDEAVQAKRDELQRQLDALDGITAPVKKKAASDGRAAPKPKYQSLKDPTVTWSGRGQKAAWLVDEMAESGKPLDAFLIKA